MKKYLVFLLILPYLCQSQDRVWVGTSISDKDSWFYNVHGETDIGIAFLRVTANSNLHDIHRADLKMSFRIYHKYKLGVYFSLPPMYYTFGKGYITPFNAEIRWGSNILLNIDYYKNGPIFSVMGRLPFR